MCDSPGLGGYFKPPADYCKVPGSLSSTLHVIRLPPILVVARWVFEAAVQPLPPKISRGYKNSPSGLEHVHLSRSKVLRTYLQICHIVPQPSVQNPLSHTSGVLLWILPESPSHSIVGRGVPSHPLLLNLSVWALAPFPSERPLKLFQAVTEQREIIEKVLDVIEPAKVP